MVSRFSHLWPAFAVLAALCLLGVAHAFESFGHYPPCELCLKQRDIYWFVVWGGVLMALAARWRPALLRPVCLVLAALFLAETATAIYHAGVEWKWWPGPARCTGAGVHAVSAADISALLSGQTQHIVQCDVAAWRLLFLSMAGWNALVALALTAASAVFAWKGPHRA